MTTLLGFGFTNDDAKERARARRDAETARQAQLDAYGAELAGLHVRLAQNAYELERVEAALETALPHFRAPVEAERENILRIQDRLSGRVDLVKLELKRVSAQ
jgi:hypothetical protein